MLLEIRELGLPHIDITTDPDNLPSQRVILANGGVFVEAFTAGGVQQPCRVSVSDRARLGTRNLSD